MKILKPQEMAAVDQAAAACGVPTRILMENAGREVAAFLVEQFPRSLEQGLVVLAGPGNNGGDGFVVARLIREFGYPVIVLFSNSGKDLAGDPRANADLYQRLGGTTIDMAEHLGKEPFLSCGLVLDALYGTGFRGSLSGTEASFTEWVNNFADSHHVPVVALDIPSGVNGETGMVEGAAIAADVTIALQTVKPGHLLFPGASYCGEVFVADIGVPSSLPEMLNIDRNLLIEDEVAELLQRNFLLPGDVHKGDRGKVLVIGGSPGYFGAPRMSAEAALKVGAGLVALVLPNEAKMTFGLEPKELICKFVNGDGEGSFGNGAALAIAEFINGFDVIILGPGLGLGSGAIEVVEKTLRIAQEKKFPLIVDADALNIIATNKKMLSLLGSNMVLTPHPGEMARLLQTTIEQVQAARLESAQKLSTAGCAVVLKGARTVISSPDGGIDFSPFATPTLATAGSGDVLCGIMAAMLTRRFSFRDAIKVAVFVHGKVGEMLQAEHPGGVGVSAAGIIELTSKAVRELLALHTGERRFISKVLSRI